MLGNHRAKVSRKSIPVGDLAASTIARQHLPRSGSNSKMTIAAARGIANTTLPKTKQGTAIPHRTPTSKGEGLRKFKGISNLLVHKFG
jgi:hypothetical protein